MASRKRTLDLPGRGDGFAKENATTACKSQKLRKVSCPVGAFRENSEANGASSSGNKTVGNKGDSDCQALILKHSSRANVREVVPKDQSSGAGSASCKACGRSSMQALFFGKGGRQAEQLQGAGSGVLATEPNSGENELCSKCIKSALKPLLDSLACESCGREDQEESMLMCDACDRGFHMHCLKPILVAVPQDKWFCPHCIRKPQSIPEFPLVQTKIIDFFKISRGLEVSAGSKRRRRSGKSILCVGKKKRMLVAHRPSVQPERRLQQLASLATAIMSSGMQFSDELTYSSDLAPRSANNTSLEVGGMQVMGKSDRAAYDAFKDMCRKGQCPPLMLKYDSVQGWVVEADDPIPDWTLVAEYTGDVDFVQSRLHDDGDSMMELLRTEDPKDALVICPHVRGNIGRFFSGINNHSRDGRKKINLRAVRFDVDGEAKVFLIAIRDIRRGEKLYYDYNGLTDGYPTQHFV